MKRTILVVMMFALMLSAQETYFPKGALSSNDRSDAAKSNLYGRQLKALDEPSLSRAGDADVQSYRFTWLRSFHQPVAVRIEVKSDSTGLLFLKVTNGAGGYKPGKLIKNTSRPLSLEQTTKFLTIVDQTRFWDTPSTDEDAAGVDGAQWIVEGAKLENTIWSTVGHPRQGRSGSWA